jgi:uncharacterized membrane protein YdjX (TVP38/TMEM64 family)
VTAYLLFFALLVAINMMPAFGPPTWAVIALYALNSELSLPALIVLGAIAAATGRFALAKAFTLLSTTLSRKRKQHLAAARVALTRRKRGALVALALFVLSPLPSAQLFEAAGLMRVPLLGFTAAFFSGRLVTYSLYATSARSLRNSSLGDVLADGITSPLGVAIQLIAIGVLVAMARIDWASRLGVHGAD